MDEFKARYRAGTVGDVEVKQALVEAINATLDPMRERRAEILSQPDRIREILHDGSAKARAVAQATMADVRAAVRLTYG